MKRLLVLLLGVLLCLSVTTATGLPTTTPAKRTKVLQASKDNILIESSNGELSSGRGPALFVGRTGQTAASIRRGLIAFDIAKNIPAGSRITSVKLTLSLTMKAGRTAQVTLHRVLADWGEGRSLSAGGRGAQATEGDATWLHTFSPDKFWSQPGGDFVSGESAARMVDAQNATWGSTPQMVADVQAWLDTPKENYGWLLRGDETQGATALVFHSREGENLAARPRLTVTFIPPARNKRR